MTKVYQKQGRILHSWLIRISVKEDGKEVQKPVSFSGGRIGLINPNCKFATDDKKIQEALEKHPMFKKPDGFDLVKSSEENSLADGGGGGTKIPSVTTIAEAKAHILANYKEKGYSQADLSDVAKIAAVAAGLEISFPNLKE